MFPIEEEAAVVNFTAEVEGRTIKTEVRKKEEAKAAYDKAMQVFKLLSVIGSTCLLTDTFIYVLCCMPSSDKLCACKFKSRQTSH
jgi:hypothetical protein